MDIDKKYIVTDITSLRRWSRPPVGIIRTQLEWVKYLINNNSQALFVEFNSEKSSIFEVPKEDVLKLIDRLAKISHSNSNKFEEKGDIDEVENLEKNIEVKEKKDVRRVSSRVLKIKVIFISLKEGCKRFCPKPIFKVLKKILSKIRCESDNIEQINIEPRNIANKNNCNDFCSETICKSFMVPHFLTRNAIFVSVGLDWDHSNYQLLYWLKKRVGFEFVGAFYDGIPILRPELVQSYYFSQKFFVHFYYLSHLSNKIFTISKNSEKEFLTIHKNHNMRPPLTKVIYLGSEIPKTQRTQNSKSKIKDYPADYLLYVSTVESRKNHKLLIEIWQDFIENGVDAPNLIFVGMEGWGVENMMNSYREDEKLQKKIYFYSDIDDDELIFLYKNSKFTLFPSLAEGWGLGAIESLLFGKVCIVSKIPSLLEATQNLVPALEPNDKDGWSREIIKLYQDSKYRKSLEDKIRSNFIPRSWNDFGEAFYKFILESK